MNNLIYHLFVVERIDANKKTVKSLLEMKLGLLNIR